MPVVPGLAAVARCRVCGELFREFSEWPEVCPACGADDLRAVIDWGQPGSSLRDEREVAR